MIEALLVPRKEVYFAEIPGELVGEPQTIPLILRRPLSRGKSGDEGDSKIKGWESGYRSALMEVEGKLYKIKGCRPTGKSTYQEPKGSQLFSMAQYEAERTTEVGEAFRKEGFEYPIQPLGFWTYAGFMLNGEPNAATIYRVTGDTRLDEFYWWLNKDLSYVSFDNDIQKNILDRFFWSIGARVGRMIRILHNHNFSWDFVHPRSNAHPGNVVLFPNSEGNLGIGLVDLGNVISYLAQSDTEIKELTQHSELKAFIARAGEGNLLSQERYRKVWRRKDVGKALDKIEDYLDKIVGSQTPEEKKLYVEEFKEATSPLIGRYYVNLLICDAVRYGYSDPYVESPIITWRDLVEFRNEIVRIRRDQERETRFFISAKLKDVERLRKEDQDRKSRYWSSCDDGYVFSNGNQISVAYYDWNPRFSVYLRTPQGKLELRLEGIHPQLGMIAPDRQGFTVMDFSQGKLRVITPEEVKAHFQEVEKSLRWWEYDMKRNDEYNVYPTTQQLKRQYLDLFNYALFLNPELLQHDSSLYDLVGTLPISPF